MRSLFIAIFLSIFSFQVFAGNVDKAAVEKAGQSWAEAIAKRDPANMAKLYNKQAFLFATFSNVLDTPDAIHNYFVKLFKHEDLKVNFQEQNIRLYGDAAINSGLYTFTFTENGKTVSVPGRYTFVYHDDADGLKIIDHHSSVLPEND